MVPMLVVALVFAALSGLLHVFIWYLESFAWTTRARAVFGTSEQEAEATRELAFNQGFYNLFLAVMALLGAALVVSGHGLVGRTLVWAGVGSMLVAAVLLGLTSPDKRGAALRQGAFPLVTLAFFAAA